MTFMRLSFGSISWKELFLFFSVREILVGAFIPKGNELFEPIRVSRGEVLVFTTIVGEMVKFPRLLA